MQTTELKKNESFVDNEYDEVGILIQDLSQIVEKEISAFQILLDALMEQQYSILEGDAMSVSLSSEEVERIVGRTKKLENERRGKSEEISLQLNSDSGLTLSQIVPLVEDKYASRLQELKETFLALAEKVQNTNKRNRFLLENSLKFVDKSLKILIQSQRREVAYSRNGKMESPASSMFSGVG